MNISKKQVNKLSFGFILQNESREDSMKRKAHPHFTGVIPKDEQKGIHIHIPKTAGICVNNYLKWVAPHMISSHMGADEVRNYMRIWDGFWEEMFKFSFVRNPWDRAVSYYLFFKRHSSEEISFKDFIINKHRGHVHYTNGLDGYDILSCEPFLCDKDGNVLVDFIGQVEHFDKDFDYIRKKLELKPLKKYTKINSHWKYRSADKYQNWYDKETRKYVEERCEWDIKNFGYKF